MSQDEWAAPGQPTGDPATGEEPEPIDPAHRGEFAEGEAQEHVAPGTVMGDFAAGQETTARSGTVQPKGDFATGEEQEPVDPAALRGDFARGQEETPRR